MGRIAGWTKTSNGHINGLHEWQNNKTKQRVLYYPYGMTSKYKLIIESREGVKEGFVANKHSANFGATRFMRSHPKG